MQPYWHKQTNQALFPDLEWNKPERRDQAGRILIVGGHVHSLGAPAQAFAQLKQAGIGHLIVALPNKTKRLVGSTLPEALFLPSTPSGELSQDGEEELLSFALSSDSVLLPGDMGRNSQTTVLTERLLRSYTGQAIITRDACDLLLSSSKYLVDREQTTLVLSIAQLQKLLQRVGFTQAISFTMDLTALVDVLHAFTAEHHVALVTMLQHQYVVAAGGQVSTTKLPTEGSSEPVHWRLAFATTAAAYQTWNPAKPFEALTYAAYLLQ